MKKRILSFILVLTLLFSLVCNIASCTKKGEDDTSSKDATDISDTSSKDTTDTEDATSSDTSSTDDENDNKKVELLYIDYDTMTYVGTSNKDFSKLFDEQLSSGDPLNNKIRRPSSVVPAYDADDDGVISESDLETVFEVTVDLDVKYYVECVYFYYTSAGKSITVEAGTPFNYEFSQTAESVNISWSKIDLKDNYQYLNFKFKNDEAPNEILIYGYPVEEAKTQETVHAAKTFSYFLGINGNRGDSVFQLKCANYFRDYFTWTWAYEKDQFPNPGTTFAGTNSSSYDLFYNSLYSAKISTVPCLQWTNAGNAPGLDGMDKYLPETYIMYGEFVNQIAVRYGNNPNNTKSNVFLYDGPKRVNTNLISWIELGNEPNGEGNDGFTPYQLAALTSCAYDGHNSTIFSASGSGVGVKNADPNIKVAMAGLAGIATSYVRAMTFWLTNNRSDGSLGMDAFNVHTYCRKQITYNGYSIYVGVCPEVGGITDEVKKLVAFRDKYFPDTEVWVTEFGWDTNQSYETENSCHAYGDYTAREVQAMWIVRAYFMFAEAGVDRAAMYMCKDTGNEETTVGKYGTSGVIASNGDKKDSYYYIYTLKNTMSDMYFAEVIDSGNEDIWIYRFENGEGKSCYAVWCPSMDNVKVDNYVLKIDGNTATLTEFANLQESGVSSDLTVTDGTVTVNVSEKPILVFSSNN